MEVVEGGDARHPVPPHIGQVHGQRLLVLGAGVVVAEGERRVFERDGQHFEHDGDGADSALLCRHLHLALVDAGLGVGRHVDGAPEVLGALRRHVPLAAQRHQDVAALAQEVLDGGHNDVLGGDDGPTLALQLAGDDEHLFERLLGPQEEAERLVFARAGEEPGLADGALRGALHRDRAWGPIAHALAVGGLDCDLLRVPIRHRPGRQRLLVRLGVLSVVRHEQIQLRTRGNGRRQHKGWEQHASDHLPSPVLSSAFCRLPSAVCPHSSNFPPTGTRLMSSSQMVPSPMW